MDREAAKQALGSFTAGTSLTANQIEFVNLIGDHLTEQGAMKRELLYESPCTDLTPQGPEGVFNSTQIDELLALISQVRARAVACGGHPANRDFVRVSQVGVTGKFPNHWFATRS